MKYIIIIHETVGDRKFKFKSEQERQFFIEDIMSIMPDVKFSLKEENDKVQLFRDKQLFRVAIVLLCFVFSSCAHYTMPISRQEYCLSYGLIDGGFREISSSGYATSLNGNFFLTSSKGHEISCNRPLNDYEKCLIEAMTIPARDIVNYNQKAKKREKIRNALIVSLLGIPVAIPLHYYWKSESEDEIKKLTIDLYIASIKCSNENNKK